MVASNEAEAAIGDGVKKSRNVTALEIENPEAPPKHTGSGFPDRAKQSAYLKAG